MSAMDARLVMWMESLDERLTDIVDRLRHLDARVSVLAAVVQDHGEALGHQERARLRSVPPAYDDEDTLDEAGDGTP